MLLLPFYAAWSLKTSWDNDDLIGRGRFATVRKCKHDKLGEVAVKCFCVQAVVMVYNVSIVLFQTSRPDVPLYFPAHWRALKLVHQGRCAIVTTLKTFSRKINKGHLFDVDVTSLFPKYSDLLFHAANTCQVPRLPMFTPVYLPMVILLLWY